MSAVELSDLKPRRTSFRLNAVGGKKKLYMRPFALIDEARIQEMFPNESLADILNTSNDLKKVLRILWHQLEERSKNYILDNVPKYEATEIPNGMSDDGETIKDEYLLILFLDRPQIEKAIEAFADCRGLNTRMFEKAVTQSDGEKKTVIGTKFSIFSPLSTVTQ